MTNFYISTNIHTFLTSRSNTVAYPWLVKVLLYHHITNLQRTLMKDIVRRQMAFFGRVIRKEEMENLVVTGYVEVKRAKGCQRETFLTYLHNMKGKKPA